MSASGRLIDGRATWFANYTLLDATFRQSVRLPGANNPAAVDGEVEVGKGDRLPLVPEHLAKAGIDVSVTEKLALGAELNVGSAFHFRGDEGNDVSRTGDFALLNVRLAYRVSSTLLGYLDVDNVFDERYNTFGVFGEADEVLGDDFEDTRFVGPGAPRGVWLGVQLEFN